MKRYLCQRCLNHDEYWPRKVRDWTLHLQISNCDFYPYTNPTFMFQGHKPFCRYADCACHLCTLVDERRRLNNAITQQVNINNGPDDTDDEPLQPGVREFIDWLIDWLIFQQKSATQNARDVECTAFRRHSEDIRNDANSQNVNVEVVRWLDRGEGWWRIR